MEDYIELFFYYGLSFTNGENANLNAVTAEI
jgi:hypothetical protein